MPHVRHLLIDQSGMPPTAVVGGLKGQIAQLLLMAAMRAQAQAVLAQAVPLLAELVAAGGTEARSTFFLYLFATQERALVLEVLEAVEEHQMQVGGDLVTYAEELIEEGLQKGLQEGRQEGKLEVIAQLLAAGTPWQIITQATGITPETFAALKAEVSRRTTNDPTAGSEQG